MSSGTKEKQQCKGGVDNNNNKKKSCGVDDDGGAAATQMALQMVADTNGKSAEANALAIAVMMLASKGNDNSDVEQRMRQMPDIRRNMW